MSKSGNYIGGHTILHEGSPFFYKTNNNNLSKIHKQKNYLKEIENQLNNVQMLMTAKQNLIAEKNNFKKRKKIKTKDNFEGNLYYWLLTIFHILRKRKTKLRKHPEIESVVISILLDMGVNNRLLNKVQKKVEC